MRSKKKSCGEIVDRLVADFSSSNEKGLKQEEGTITQDFISRGLHGTTARVSKLLGFNYEFLQKLVEYLIKCLKEDYSHIPPASFKQELTRVVESEYNSLIGKVSGWLHESQQLSELKQFQDGVTASMTKVKKEVENKCALWEQRWKVKKRRKRIESIKGFLKWFVGPGLGVAIIVWLCRGYLPYKEQSTEVNTVAQGSLPAGVLINRLIEDYEARIDKYFVEFETQYEKVVDDFVEGKSHQSPLDAGLFENAVLEIENRFRRLTRGIQDLLLEEYGSTEFDRIKDVSNEFVRYQEAIEKTKQLKDEITKMEHDPARITAIFDKLNRKK